MNKKHLTILKAIFGWAFWASLLAILLFALLVVFTNFQRLTDGIGFGVILAAVGLVMTLVLLLTLRLCCRHGWRRTFFIFGCFALIVIIFYAEEDLRGWHTWQQFKQQAEAAGEKLDFASIVPPAVPDEQNFAMAPIVASSYAASLDKNGHKITPQLTNVVQRLRMNIFRDNDDNWKQQPTNGSWAKATLTDLKAWQIYFSTPPTNSLTNEFPVPRQPQSAATDVLFGLSKYDSDIEELRKASQLPQSRFPINYDSDIPFAALLPHLSPLKRCPQALQLRALAELELGQTDKALDDIRLSLRLMDSIRSEPFLISHLVRMAQFQITLQPIYEGLARRQFSDVELIKLQAELTKFNFLNDCQSALRGERNSSLATIDYLGRSKSYHKFMMLISSGFEGEKDEIRWNLILSSTLYWLAPSGWFWSNKALIGEIHQKWTLRVCDPEKHLVSPSIANQADSAICSIPRRPANCLAAMLLPALAPAEKKFAYTQSSADMAMIACALERYRLANKTYPDSLDKLCPQLLDQIPHDVINGQPLKYRLSDDGQFLLYSVGWNEVDDGGKVGLNKAGGSDIKTGDWVWKYPNNGNSKQ